MEQLQITLTINQKAITPRKVLGLCFCLAILFLSGCATQPKRNISPVISESAVIFQSREFAVFEIPSRGALSDGLSISANGGRHTKNLSAAFASLSNSDNSNIVVYSANPDLSYAVIIGAITDNKYPNIWLVYVGSESNSKLLSAATKLSDIKYSFVDIVNNAM